MCSLQAKNNTPNARSGRAQGTMCCVCACACQSLSLSLSVHMYTTTYTHMHARTHERTHPRTFAHTQETDRKRLEELENFDVLASPLSPRTSSKVCMRKKKAEEGGREGQNGYEVLFAAPDLFVACARLCVCASVCTCVCAAHTHMYIYMWHLHLHVCVSVFVCLCV